MVILVALMPLRALAGVTVGFCAAGHQDMAVTGHAVPGERAHQGHDSPPQPVKSSCNICAEHCSGAAFAPAGDVAVDARPIGQGRARFAERHTLAFFPDQLDRPPLA